MTEFNFSTAGSKSDAALRKPLKLQQKPQGSSLLIAIRSTKMLSVQRSKLLVVVRARFVWGKVRQRVPQNVGVVSVRRWR